MLRVVQVALPAARADALRALLEEQELVAEWQQDAHGDLRIAHLLVRSNRAEPLIDLLQQKFGSEECFRALLMRVHATVPELDQDEPESEASNGGTDEPAPPERVARAEIRNELETGIDVGPVFLATVVLSSIIAAVGLLTENVAVIIGAMVVAPLLTPNMAMAFAVTIGDLKLLRSAARTAILGALTGFAFALLIGWISDEPVSAQMKLRMEPGAADVLLALASGAAGALAFTSGVSASLVGVMVAVALLPPLLVSGMMVADGEFAMAGGAATLLAINVICVVLAAVSTFMWRGVRPRTWWEKDKARRYTRRTMILCLVLVSALAVLLLTAFS